MKKILIIFSIVFVLFISCKNNTTAPAEKIKISQRAGNYKAIKNMGSYDVSVEFTLDNKANINSLKLGNANQLPEGSYINISKDVNNIGTEYTFQGGRYIFTISFESDTKISGGTLYFEYVDGSIVDMPLQKVS
ncbi:hypothetical protein [Brachyspira intermedia]|uniref:hypothetical protein n=1 Tax=Brachyspira intermedia TaxID=84377 RepID=UPI0030043611